MNSIYLESIPELNIEFDYLQKELTKEKEKMDKDSSAYKLMLNIFKFTEKQNDAIRVCITIIINNPRIS
jgi:hypothetical protein